MKKLFLFLLALPFVAFTSCDDDDKVPNVDMTVQLSNCTLVDNTIYVVKGETFTVDAVTIDNHSGKDVMIGGVEYYWDYYRLNGSVTPPYTLSFATEGIPAGSHYLQIIASIYAVDYEPCVGVVGYKVKIVNSEADIPTEGNVTTNPSVTATIQEKDATN